MADTATKDRALTQRDRRSQPSSVQLQRGRKLGKYRLLKRLGIGGAGEVWKARDLVEGIWVALKIPHTDLAGRRDNQSVLREVRMVSQLRHPHILPVKNADIIDGHAVLATALSAGTLDDKHRPMAVGRIVPIICQVLEGLAYAHQNRLVHCDVTPGNIFLFPDGHAALGDFGISQQFRRHMITMEDFGTPGYVAPEQAYGRPSYRSDCFSVGLILYEYLTGYLPRWPFSWPIRGLGRFRDRTNPAMVRFIRQALAVEPKKRFANAQILRTALVQALPEVFEKSASRKANGRANDWKRVRRSSFIRRYGKTLNAGHACKDCGEPIAESMTCCPWCGSHRNRYDTTTKFSHVCYRCHHGVLPEWTYCPWCFGPGFASPAEDMTRGVTYHDHCRHCKGKLMRFMCYCPWCRRKVRKPWRVNLFPETCGSCGWSVDSSFWHFCPWCENRLIT